MSARDEVAGKLDHLFRTIRRDDGREFTYDEVEQGTGGRVSRSYVWKLRHGKNTNPSLDVVEALAEFFSVPPSYFFGPGLGGDEEAKEAAAIASLLRDERAREVATRARGLSPEAHCLVINLLDAVKRLDRQRPSRPDAQNGARDS